MRLFGTSGIRRLADRHLIELSLQVGIAVGTVYKNVVIGRDTRTSGCALDHAVTAGLLAAGSMPYDAGLLPTPTLALATSGFEAGIMITASHNPPQYNGLKLINPDGSAFSPAQQKQIEEMISGPDSIDLKWDFMQESRAHGGAIQKHLQRILSQFQNRRPIKVVVDCGGGAACVISPAMLTQMGCTVAPLNCTATGIFPHPVEPVEANLVKLKEAVKESGAALGIAHDGDADRVMVVDDLGRFVSGDKLLAIFARHSGSSDIVTTIDASMSIEEMNLNVRRTPVGDPYVSEELKKGGGFGGEPSGAWVFPQISLCPDGIYGAACIVDIVRRQKLSELADSLPDYPVIRGNINGVIHSMDSLKDRLVNEFKPLSVSTVDGLKMVFEDGWLLVRASGTEPKIRISGEARNKLTVSHYYEQAAKMISSLVCEGKL